MVGTFENVFKSTVAIYSYTFAYIMPHPTSCTPVEVVKVAVDVLCMHTIPLS